jgi:hypothetical protein
MSHFARTAALMALFPLRYYAYLTETADPTAVAVRSTTNWRNA